MAVMDRTGVARSLEQIASYLEFKGENPFRVRAFTAAARSILGYSGRSRDRHRRRDHWRRPRESARRFCRSSPNWSTTGRAGILEELRAEVPAGLVDMLGIPGLGVAKIRQIQETLGIETLPDLEAAARDGRLAALPRFGPRTAEKILKGIAFLRQASQWRLSHHAAREAEALREAFARLPHMLSAHTAGEVRRRCEVVRELVTVLVADVPPEEVFRQLGTMPGVSEIAGEDERRVDAAVCRRQQRAGRRHAATEFRRGAGAGDRQRSASRGAGVATPPPGVQPGRDRALAGSRSCRRRPRRRCTQALGLAVDTARTARDGRRSRAAGTAARRACRHRRFPALPHQRVGRHATRSKQIAEACQAAGYQYRRASPIIRGPRRTPADCRSKIRGQWEEIDADQCERSGLSRAQGHRKRHPCRWHSRLSRRCPRRIRFRDRIDPFAIQS